MHQFTRWREPIQCARSEAALTGVVRDYLATISPEMLSILPKECSKLLLAWPLNVPEVAVELLKSEMKYDGDGEARDLLREIARTFAAASVRMSVLRDLPAR